MPLNSVRPRVRDQIAPRALEILAPFISIPEGYTEDGVPKFTGIPDSVWLSLLAKKPKLFAELLEILRTDYPTYAALVLKIFAKKVGHLIPFIFNDAQAIAWNKIAGRIAAHQVLFIVFLKAR